MRNGPSGPSKARKAIASSRGPPPVPASASARWLSPSRRVPASRTPASATRGAGLRIAGTRRLGDSHLALALAGAGGPRLDAIAFRAFEGPLGPFLVERTGGGLHLAGRLERDDWGGRPRVKLHVEDAAPGE